MHANKGNFSQRGYDPVSAALVHILEAKMRIHGWKPADLAAESGVPKQTISALLNQKNKLPPELTTLAPLAKALGIPLADLIEAVGYSVGELNADSEVMRMAHLLREVPWMAAGVNRMMELSPEELDDLLGYMEFRISQKRRKPPG